MTFPFTHSKAINISDLDLPDEVILAKIKRGLLKGKAKDIIQNSNIVSFRGGIFRFVRNTNILIPITYGEISLHQSSNAKILNYSLNFSQLLATVTIMVFCFIVPFAFINFQNTEHNNGFFLVIAAPIMWLWLFGMNYVLTVFRFPSFIKKIIGSV